MLPKNLNAKNNIEKEKIIVPQGKRRYKIILKAHFDGKDKEIEKITANMIGKMGVFD